MLLTCAVELRSVSSGIHNREPAELIAFWLHVQMYTLDGTWRMKDSREDLSGPTGAHTAQRAWPVRVVLISREKCSKC